MRKFWNGGLDHFQPTIKAAALLGDRGLDTEFGQLVHWAAGVVFKLLPLPMIGQVGRRGVASHGCAMGLPHRGRVRVLPDKN